MSEEKREAYVLDLLAETVHKDNKKWWLDLDKPCAKCDATGLSSDATKKETWPCLVCKGNGYLLKKCNVGELLMLVVSELSEALEGHRKDLYDDKLPPYKMFDVEIVDATIRLFNIAGALIPQYGEIFEAKMQYNAHRADHRIENRLAEGGKKY